MYKTLLKNFQFRTLFKSNSRTFHPNKNLIKMSNITPKNNTNNINKNKNDQELKLLSSSSSSTLFNTNDIDENEDDENKIEENKENFQFDPKKGDLNLYFTAENKVKNMKKKLIQMKKCDQCYLIKNLCVCSNVYNIFHRISVPSIESSLIKKINDFGEENNKEEEDNIENSTSSSSSSSTEPFVSPLYDEKMSEKNGNDYFLNNVNYEIYMHYGEYGRTSNTGKLFPIGLKENSFLSIFGIKQDEDILSERLLLKLSNFHINKLFENNINSLNSIELFSNTSFYQNTVSPTSNNDENIVADQDNKNEQIEDVPPVLILYPSKDAVTPEQLIQQKWLEKNEKLGISLCVIDSTWSQSMAMKNRLIEIVERKKKFRLIQLLNKIKKLNELIKENNELIFFDEENNNEEISLNDLNNFDINSNQNQLILNEFNQNFNNFVNKNNQYYEKIKENYLIYSSNNTKLNQNDKNNINLFNIFMNNNENNDENNINNLIKLKYELILYLNINKIQCVKLNNMTTSEFLNRKQSLTKFKISTFESIYYFLINFTNYYNKYLLNYIYKFVFYYEIDSVLKLNGKPTVFFNKIDVKFDEDLKDNNSEKKSNSIEINGKFMKPIVNKPSMCLICGSTNGDFKNYGIRKKFDEEDEKNNIEKNDEQIKKSIKLNKDSLASTISNEEKLKRVQEHNDKLIEMSIYKDEVRRLLNEKIYRVWKCTCCKQYFPSPYTENN